MKNMFYRLLCPAYVTAFEKTIRKKTDFPYKKL